MATICYPVESCYIKFTRGIRYVPNEGCGPFTVFLTMKDAANWIQSTKNHTFKRGGVTIEKAYGENLRGKGDLKEIAVWKKWPEAWSFMGRPVGTILWENMPEGTFLVDAITLQEGK